MLSIFGTSEHKATCTSWLFWQGSNNLFVICFFFYHFLLLFLFFCSPFFSFHLSHSLIQHNNNNNTPLHLLPFSSCPTFHPSFRGSAQLKSYRPLHIDIVHHHPIHLLLLQGHLRLQKNLLQVIPDLIMATWLVIHCHVVALLVLLEEQHLQLPTVLVKL